MMSTALALSKPAALPAMPLPALRCPSVLCGEFMAAQAMRLTRIYCPYTFSAHYVLNVANWLKMRWIHAFTVSTKMIYNEIMWNIQSAPCVCKTVCKSVSSCINPESSIFALRMNRAEPCPATVAFNKNLFKKTNLELMRYSMKGIYKNLIYFLKSAFSRMISVVLVLARNASVVIAIGRMCKRIKVGSWFCYSASFTGLHKINSVNVVCPNNIMSKTGFVNYMVLE